MIVLARVKKVHQGGYGAIAKVNAYELELLAEVVLDEQEAKAKLEVLDILPPKGALWT